jgi:phage baseplate assembly protein gpV/phage protein D
MGIERLPELTIAVDGVPMPAAGGPLQGLRRLVVRQELNLPAQCELVFADPPGQLDGLDERAAGASLRLSMSGSLEPLFNGLVTAVEYTYLPAGQNEIRLRGYDPSWLMRKRQEARVHVQTTTGELAGELVKDLGLEVKASGAEPGLLEPRLFQNVQSDYDLLLSQLEQSGYYYQVREQTFHLFTLEGLEREAVELVLGDNLFELHAEVNHDPLVSSILAAGWSSDSVESYTVVQNQARSGRRTGAEMQAHPGLEESSRRLYGASATSSTHLEARAQAELDRRHSKTVVVWGVTRGNADLFPGAPVTIGGAAAAVAGRHILTRVEHTLDPERGFLTRFSSAPPAARSPLAESCASLGIVVDVADPEGLGRVRVSLQAYGELESGWLRVIAPAAGPQKGLVMLPEVDDRVLILFTHRETGQAVVIGGFYAPDPPYDPGVENGSVRRYSLRTPDGHLLQLDDARRTLRLEDSRGSFVEMSPQKMQVFSNTDLEISAPGREIVIQAEKIDFRRAA